MTTFSPSIVLAGFESAGKTALFRRLTGEATGHEANFRGSTVSCRSCHSEDCQCEIIDTPGVRLKADTETTRLALEKIHGSDTVLLVVRGTNLQQEMEGLLGEINASTKRLAVATYDFDVIIIGAGPAGLGVALPLIECGITRICILEARTVGASFENWPKQMRLVTPSFHSNPFRQPDLNAITIETSPADFIRSEHPTGREYAAYLRSVVNHYQLPVREGVTVGEITPCGSHFEVETSEGQLTSRYVIWAADEFFYPLDDDFDGAQLCLHNTKVADWTKLEGDEFAIIGGYESGVDAAVHLLRNGKTVHLLSRGQPWKEDSADPSNALSPHTRDRLRAITSEAAPPNARARRYAEAMKAIS